MTPHLGESVIYRSELFGKMETFAAFVTRIHSETVVDLHVLGGVDLGTIERARAAYSAVPVSGSWCYPGQNEEQRQVA